MRSRMTLCLMLLVGAPAAAGTVTPPWYPGSCSRVPARVVLVGARGGVPDTRVGSFEVIVCRWYSPTPNASVDIGMPYGRSGQTSVKLGRMSDPQPILSACGPGDLKFSADANGVCRITITGTIRLADVNPLDAPPAIGIYAEGVLFGNVPVVCFDLDGVNGVGPGDLSRWLTLFADGTNLSVADYDGNGVLGPNDLALLLGVFSQGNETESAVPLCP